MTDEQRVDPRYDPAFQRGFEGSVTSALRGRPVSQRDAIVTPAPFRTADAAEVPADDDGRDAQAPVAPVRAAEARPTDDDVVDDSPAAAPRRLSRNPYLIAVTLLGVIVTGGGAAWGNQARSLVAGRGGAATDLDYWFLQATVVGAPITIVAGVLILAGVLFFVASAWQRR